MFKRSLLSLSLLLVVVPVAQSAESAKAPIVDPVSNSRPVQEDSTGQVPSGIKIVELTDVTSTEQQVVEPKDQRTLTQKILGQAEVAKAVEKEVKGDAQHGFKGVINKTAEKGHLYYQRAVTDFNKAQGWFARNTFDRVFKVEALKNHDVIKSFLVIGFGVAVFWYAWKKYFATSSQETEEEILASKFSGAANNLRRK